MIPMIPKIRVRPLATRKSRSPYWTAFRIWMRKKEASTVARRPAGARGTGAPRAPSPSLHPAAHRRVGEGRDGHGDDLVLLALHLAEVDVVHRVVGLGHGHGAARALDLGA